MVGKNKIQSEGKKSTNRKTEKKLNIENERENKK